MVSTTPNRDVTNESFIQAMARVCTPVAVVTTFDDSPHGTTVSAFASLSVTPPMVLVALDQRSVLLARCTKTQKFGLNVLASHQSPLAVRFAKKGSDAFEGFTWHEESGCPRIEGVVVWLACRLVDLVDGGDHRVALGEVLQVHSTDAEPLTYHSREFGTHAPATVAPR